MLTENKVLILTANLSFNNLSFVRRKAKKGELIINGLKYSVFVYAHITETHARYHVVTTLSF